MRNLPAKILFLAPFIATVALADYSGPTTTYTGVVQGGPPQAISVLDARVGAKCDGTTDDTTAFATAQTVAGVGGSISIPSNLTCRGKIIDTVAGLNWIVNGTIKGPDGMTGEVFQCSAANVTITGSGTIDGNRASAGLSDIGIYGNAADGCSAITIKDITVAHTKNNAGTAGYGVQIIDVPNTTLQNTYITDTGSIGAFFNTSAASDVPGLKIIGNRCDRTAEGSGIRAGCIQVHADGGGYWTNAVTSGNQVYCPISPAGNYVCLEEKHLETASVTGNTAVGNQLAISIAQSIGFTVSGNSTRSGSVYDIEIPNGSYFTVSANTANGFAADGITPLTQNGIEIDGTSSNGTVTGNTVVGVANAGIGIIETGTSGSKHVAITGNTFNGGGTSTNAVQATDSFPLTISGNEFNGWIHGINIIEDDGSVVSNVTGSGNSYVSVTTPIATSLTGGSTLGTSVTLSGNGLNATCIGSAQYFNYIGKVLLCSGSGSPKGSLTAGIGSLYLETDAAPTLWTNAGGTSAGWIPVTQGAGNSTVQSPDGRLTLISGSPIMAADISAATTIYLDDYNGNQVPVYDGTNWNSLTITSAEISMGLDAVTPHVASGSLYDVFAISNSGALALCVGPAWSTAVSRGSGAGTTAISQFNAGIYTNANDLTHCWGGASGTTDYGTISAHQGTYLGTLYATANGQTQMNLIPVAAGGGSISGGNIIGLWNMYNRIVFQSSSRDNTATWTNSSSTYGAADAGATGSGFNNRISFVDGLGQSQVFVSEKVGAAVVATTANIGIDANSTSATPSNISQAASTSKIPMSYDYVNSMAKIGFNYYQAMENSGTNLSTVTYSGNLVLRLQSTY